jgi:hypothetical protein
MSIIASNAALTVLPVYITSSTSITVLFLMSKLNLCSPMLGCSNFSVRSSLYRVISIVPTGTFTPSNSCIISEIRFASGTPLVLIPTNTTFSVPLFFSMIS